MDNEKPDLGRRNALKIIATSAASVPLAGSFDRALASPAAATTSEKLAELEKSAKKPQRTPTDPDLLNPTIDWDFLLSEAELATLAALCDMIIPADAISPSASSLGAHHYINEYVSAPYSNNKRDLIAIRGGLVWLNSESKKRYSRLFQELAASQKTAICDAIKWEKTAAPQYRLGAEFFAKVRNLTATAFYTTTAGMADIGYIGNKPAKRFDGAPLAVLQRLGLDGNV